MLHARLRTQWGFPDPPGLPHRGQAQGALSRPPRLVRLSGLPESRRPAHPLRPAGAGADRAQPHRGLHDGSRRPRSRRSSSTTPRPSTSRPSRARVRLMPATAVAGVSARFLDLLAQEDARPALRVLDVGCGAGRLSLALAPAASSWVVGLDRDAAADRGGAPARRRAAPRQCRVPRGRRRGARSTSPGGPIWSPPTSAPRTPSSSARAAALAPGRLPRHGGLPRGPVEGDRQGLALRLRRGAHARRARARRLRGRGARGRARRCSASTRSRRASPRRWASRTAGGPTGAGSATSRSSSRAGAR